MTTVGYGDAVPVHPVTRALAVAEALIGQLYPAILIAGVLGLALQTRFREEKWKYRTMQWNGMPSKGRAGTTGSPIGNLQV